MARIHKTLLLRHVNFIIIIKMLKYQELKEIYHSLADSSHRPVSFQNSTIREVDHNGCLERPFFAFALALAHHVSETPNSFILMVTASHNPPGYNGLKVQSLLSDSKMNEKETSELLNDEAKLLELLKQLNVTENDKYVFYLGRDKRPTSNRLSSILQNVLTLLGKNVIDFGERSTPELFSLSQFVHHELSSGSPFDSALISEYYEIIEASFCQAIAQISSNLGREWRKKTICLDLANGVGGESFKNYEFLNQFFEFRLMNTQDFHRPNVECGAQWFYKDFKGSGKLPGLGKYPSAEEYYFFDGDSDRIIGKMGHETQPIDGDDFNACFVTLLRHLFESMGWINQEIASVGNITSNEALAGYLSTIRVSFEKVPVGVRELFAAIKKHQIGCYFESSGHGCLYFSEEIRNFLSGLREKSWQARLLLLLDGLSRNNSRGYALHNLLLFQIHLFYFGAATGFIFEKSYVLNKEYKLEHPQLFVNSKYGNKLLEQPRELLDAINELKEFSREGSIVLRRSVTTPVLKLTIQGKKQHCEMISQQIEGVIQRFLREG